MTPPNRGVKFPKRVAPSATDRKKKESTGQREGKPQGWHLVTEKKRRGANFRLKENDLLAWPSGNARNDAYSLTGL